MACVMIATFANSGMVPVSTLSKNRKSNIDDETETRSAGIVPVKKLPCNHSHSRFGMELKNAGSFPDKALPDNRSSTNDVKLTSSGGMVPDMFTFL